jgi:hypothetical protein
LALETVVQMVLRKGEVPMNHFASYPELAYDHIYRNYGTIGLIIAGIVIVVGVLSVFFWFDRRK